MTTIIERKRLVAAVKDANNSLGLDPRIVTKGREEVDIQKDLLDAANGLNEETGEYEKENRVRESDNLAEDTYKVLAEIGFKIGGEKPTKAKKVKAETSEKSAKADAVEKVQKAPKEKRETRGIGRPKTWKELKAALLESEGRKDAPAAVVLDRIMLEPHSITELNELAAEQCGGVKMSINSHVRYRYMVGGYDYKDKRRSASDVTGLIQLVGLTEGVCANAQRDYYLEGGRGSGVGAPVPRLGKKDTVLDKPVKKTAKVAVPDDDGDAPKAKSKKSKK